MLERWYAARTKSAQAHIAVERLAQQSFITYWPQIELEKVKAGKIVRLKEPLFPGYLFILCHMEAANWRAINGTRGVQRLLSFSEDGHPSYILSCEIEAIQDAEKKGQFKFSEIKRFKKGDLIQIKNGISVGLKGKVVRTRGERVEFLLRLLGRQVRVIAPSHTLHLVAPAPVRQHLPA